MYWRTTIISLILLGAVPAVNAVEISTYGTGLMPCGAYVDARERDSADQIPFIDWLVGYLSGVNATSTRRNNILGPAEVKDAMAQLDRVCRARPLVHFADAVGILMMNVSSVPGAHSVEVTRYGSGFKPCQSYIEAREPQSLDSDEFIDWLGGYLSGVNAISLKTNDILGASQLTQAVYWLDDYCTSHPVEPFALAVGALVDARHRNR